MFSWIVELKTLYSNIINLNIGFFVYNSNDKIFIPHILMSCLKSVNSEANRPYF